MKPLTLDCVRVRQELGAHYDGALDDAEEAFVEAHLEGCEGCQGALSDLRAALAALATLGAEDLAKLASAPLPGEGELDSRPFAHLVLGAILLLLLVATGVALVASRARRASPPPTPARAIVQPHIPLPFIGADIGLEREGPRLPEPSPPPVERVPPSPDLIPQEAILAAIPRGALPQAARQPEEAPGPAEPKKQDMGPKPKKEQLPPALPDPALAYIQRIRFSQGLSYRGITFFFAQDPEGRDRLPTARGSALPQLSEGTPSVPEKISARPPRGRSAETVLVGELLDAPAGLRIAKGSAPLSAGRLTLSVLPVSYEGLARRRPEPILKAPVLLPSAARLALLTGTQPGPVALLLRELTHNAFSEVQRLRLESNRLEPEAKSLEQRLRARIRNTRGLRGLGVTIDGWPRAIDLFSSSRAFAQALPKLLRGALLEAHLKSFGPDDESVDWASTKILGGENQTRDRHRTLLSLAASARAHEPDGELPRKVDAVFRSPAANTGAALVYLSGTKVFHAVVVAAPPR